MVAGKDCRSPEVRRRAEESAGVVLVARKKKIRSVRVLNSPNSEHINSRELTGRKQNGGEGAVRLPELQLGERGLPA